MPFDPDLDAELRAREPAGHLAGSTLDFQGRNFVNFRDYDFADSGAHGFRWVDIKRFHLHDDPTADDSTFLRDLIAHELFRDTYATDGPDPYETRHGPYWIAKITAGAYQPIDRPTALSVLTDWADQYGPLPEQLHAVLETKVYEPVRKATSRYRLTDLGSAAFHDWGGVHGEFHELLTIDHTTNDLTLIVAADD